MIKKNQKPARVADLHWNDRDNEAAYTWVKNDAISIEGYTEEMLIPQNLSNAALKTRSKRINHMIRLAYYLGQLRGIRIADQFKDVYELR